MGIATEPRHTAHFAPSLASFGHTAALVVVMLAVAISGTLLQRAGALPAPAAAPARPSAGVLGQYLALLLVNGLLLAYVTRLFRPRNVLPQLLGRTSRTFADLFVDLLYAALAFVAIVAIEAWTRRLFPGRNAAVQALLPSTEAERLTWLLVASVVGFCEEVVYRGYLQIQLGAFTRSPALGIALQAVLFGVAHLEQGPSAALRIAFYGLIFGLLARHRASLWPGIACHIGIDLAGGLLR